MSYVKADTHRVNAVSGQKLQLDAAGQEDAPFEGVIDITGERQGAFDVAVDQATAGTLIIYHIGEFCAGPHKKDARAAYEAGRVTLAMRKRHKFLFEYMAVPVTTNRDRASWSG